MKHGFKLLSYAVMDNSRGRDDCSLVELNPQDFEELLNDLEPQLSESLNNWFRGRIINTDGSIIEVMDRIKIEDRFIFRGAIVLKNPSIERGKIKTFNKARFCTIEKSFADYGFPIE